jgi:hypothetical protein
MRPLPRCQACVVEEARMYEEPQDFSTLFECDPEAEEQTPELDYKQVIVKTYRPNFIGSAVEMETLLSECKRISLLKHE